MHYFNYSFLKNGLNSKYIKFSNLITDLRSKEQFRILQYEDTFEFLANKTINDTCISSLRLDDLNLNIEDINILSEKGEPNNQTQKELLAYRQAFTYIQDNSNVDINESLIRYLHKIINPQTFEINEYRFDENYKVSNYMYELIKAYKEAREDEDIPNLLLVPCFIVDLFNIHPFSSGNGRTNRLLMNLLLYSFDYDISKYISIDNIIYEYKNNYYEALKESSYGWQDNKNSYDSFIYFFLQVIYKAYKELDDCFIGLSIKKAKKSQRIESVIINSNKPLSKKDINNRLPDISIRTIDVVLAKLIKEMKIVKIGSFKDAKYIAK